MPRMAVISRLGAKSPKRRKKVLQAQPQLAACKALGIHARSAARNNALKRSHTQPPPIVRAALGALRTQGRDGPALSPPNNHNN